MSDHGTWKRNFAEVVRVAHAADCKYDDLEMKLSGNGPGIWEWPGGSWDVLWAHSKHLQEGGHKPNEASAVSESSQNPTQLHF